MTRDMLVFWWTYAAALATAAGTLYVLDRIGIITQAGG